MKSNLYLNWLEIELRDKTLAEALRDINRECGTAYTLTLHKTLREKEFRAVYKGQTKFFLGRAMSLMVSSRKNEYWPLDAAINAAKWFLANFLCNVRV